MNTIILRFKALIRKYNGITYDIIFILYSWIYGLFFRKLIVGESAIRFFEKGDSGINTKLFILLSAAAIAEIIGAFFIVQRIRHIRSNPSAYPDIMKSADRYYVAGDSIFFFQLWLIGCRIMLSSYIGYIAFTALGMGKLSALGCLAFVAKDALATWILVRLYGRPLQAGPAAMFRTVANILLAFSGMVFASAGFDAFMSRSYNVLCNFHHWTGFGNFVLSLILYFLFFSILYIPTRTIYYAEELEFTDSREEAVALRKSFFTTALLSIIPWLF